MEDAGGNSLPVVDLRKSGITFDMGTSFGKRMALFCPDPGLRGAYPDHGPLNGPVKALDRIRATEFVLNGKGVSCLSYRPFPIRT